VRIGEFGFLHVRRLSDFTVAPAPIPYTLKPRPRKAIAGLSEIAAAAVALSQQYPFVLDNAAAELGVPRWTLEILGIGFANKFNRKNWTVPELDASGGTIGIQYRPWGGGTKLSQEGGSRGLCYSGGWRDTAIKTGCVFLPEGMSDTAALMAMGLAAVGRPSNTGGVDLLVELLVGLPAAVRIVVVAENDAKPDGTWPGKTGAESTTAALAKRLGRPVEAMFPSDEVKDTRAWLNAQRPRLDDPAALLELGRRFLRIPCERIADALRCSDSCVLEESTVRNNRDNAIHPQGIRNPSATCAGDSVWSVPKRIFEKYDSNPWDCPAVRGVAGCKDCSPVLIAATCRRRSCPVCGQYWRLQTYIRFGTHLASHDGQLYTDVIPDWDWPSVLADMRRRAGKLDIPLRFVTLRCKEGDELVVLASVPVRADVARPVELAAALDILENAIDNADFGPRPVNACRAWGKLPVEREVERVPGGCSPAAFRATVVAWKAKPVGSERFIKCDRPGLFLVDGKLDEQLQCDFWREAETYGYAGAAAAAETRLRLAAERERNRRGPPIDPANCFHEYQERPDPERPGWLKTVCVHCGDFQGYRPAGAE
jgi:hypothetical protein